jgi:copper homeostasis protein
MFLEIIGFDILGCRIAHAAGADRIELCASPDLGGTTPNQVLIAQAMAEMQIPVYVMIRPRGGDFCYSEAEFEEMKESIIYCKSIGCQGVVFGLLTPTGHMDVNRCAELIALAQPMGCTFHRAFDVVAEPDVALEQVIELGFERILTSGQEPTALAGAQSIAAWIEQAAGRISIMPGSGITATNIAQIRSLTKATEYHASAKRVDASTGAYVGVDGEEVRVMKAV